MEKHAAPMDHSTIIQILLYGVLIISLWFAELSFIAISLKGKWQHALSNIKFIATALPVQLLMTAPVLAVSAFTISRGWGILSVPFFSHHFLLKMLIGFLALDFLDYVYHVVMHKLKPLWRFHLVHHTDQQMDVTTTVREHPGETFLRMCFLTIWVGLTGAGLSLLLLRQTFQTIVNITSHTTFRLKPVSDRLVGYLFVTPNIHHVHHHCDLPYTDCNYGDVLSIWDRLFGTYKTLGYNETRFGVDTHMEPVYQNQFLEILSIPFKKKNN